MIGSVNLTGPAHPLTAPDVPDRRPRRSFKGAFPGNMALSSDGHSLYVVDQGSFQVFTIDTTKIATGADAAGNVVEPDNFAAVVGHTKVGRYPFGISLSADDRTLLVTNVGVFQYTHLRPAVPTGRPQRGLPALHPRHRLPRRGRDAQDDQDQEDRRAARSAACRRRCAIPKGSAAATFPRTSRYTIPALGSPNVPESSSVYVLDVSRPGDAVAAPDRAHRAAGRARTRAASTPTAPATRTRWSTGGNRDLRVERQQRLDHDPERRDGHKVGDISLAVLPGSDRILKGVQPVSLALSPDRRFLYVAEAGLNAVGVISLQGQPRVAGHIPTGLVAEQREGEPRRPHAVRGQRQGARRGAEPRATWRRSTR